MKNFEHKIILELLKHSLNDISKFSENSHEDEIYFSGTGYYLTFKNIDFPKQRVVLRTPNISGKLGGIEVGFLVIIQDNELTLECHSYDGEITEKNRDNGFERTKT